MTVGVDPSDSSGTAEERLCAELLSARSILAKLISGVSKASSSLRPPEHPVSLRSERERYEEETRVLLVEPAEQFLRFRPIKESLNALQRYDSQNTATGKPRRGRLDARFQTALALAAGDLCEPWRIHRRGNHEDEWESWDRRCAAHLKQSSALLEQYARWARRVNGSSGFLQRYARWAQRPNGSAGGKGNPADQRYETWWRQERDISALLEMEVSLRDLGVTWFVAATEFVEAARCEQESIVAEATRTLDWIRETPSTSAETAKPELASPEERLRIWSNLIETEAAARLPERVELVTPGWYPKWRSVAAREVFLKAFSTSAQPPIRRTIEHFWKRIAEVAWEVSRAREIVDYWRDARGGKFSDGGALFADARHNAAAMLEKQTQPQAGNQELEEELVSAFRTWNDEGSTYIEAAQFGWVELLRPPRGFRMLGRVLREARQRGQTAAQRGGRWASSQWDRVLELFGGKVPAQPTVPPVVRRTTLRDTLALPASKTNLPALYQLLFRIAPLEDKRFLVGRDRELAGLAQALADWEGGRFAACLVVGDRGSGKTSLLNCAEKATFSHHTLIRGQFRERASRREEIDCFLRRLLHLEEEADIEEALAAQCRVIVIEECERIYLRKVGGFAGTHYLIHLIHRTAPTTLWVIVMNDKAARVLDAGAQLRRVFSHCINAASVSRSDLENAILERHRLSGLKLQFAPPPAGDPRVNRVKGWLGLHDSAQKLFFDSLFQQSEGVFRSAFELWLSSIERVEGETVRIRQPLDPAFSRFRRELAQEDHFTLLAIQEHGSLTRNELGDVLCEGHDVSRSRLDRLLALGLIEPDPEHPGFRVRPEAQRFTNDLLRRANFT